VLGTLGVGLVEEVVVVLRSRGRLSLSEVASSEKELDLDDALRFCLA